MTRKRRRQSRTTSPPTEAASAMLLVKLKPFFSPPCVRVARKTGRSASLHLRTSALSGCYNNKEGHVVHAMRVPIGPLSTSLNASLLKVTRILAETASSLFPLVSMQFSCFFRAKNLSEPCKSHLGAVAFSRASIFTRMV